MSSSRLLLSPVDESRRWGKAAGLEAVEVSRIGATVDGSPRPVRECVEWLVL